MFFVDSCLNPPGSRDCVRSTVGYLFVPASCRECHLDVSVKQSICIFSISTPPSGGSVAFAGDCFIAVPVTTADCSNCCHI